MGYPQIIHLNMIFHYKPSILGYPHLWKPPYDHSHPISAISIPAKKHVLFLHQRCCQTVEVQHLVPTVLATQDQGHNIVEDGPGAPRVLQGATLVDFWCLTGDFQWFNDDNDGWFSILITALLSYMDFDSTWFLVSFYSCWITDAFLFFAWLKKPGLEALSLSDFFPVLVVRVSCVLHHPSLPVPRTRSKAKSGWSW